MKEVIQTLLALNDTLVMGLRWTSPFAKVDSPVLPFSSFKEDTAAVPNITRAPASDWWFWRTT